MLPNTRERDILVPLSTSYQPPIGRKPLDMGEGKQLTMATLSPSPDWRHTGERQI